MPTFDLIVRNATIVTESAAPALADMAIADGRIVEIGPELSGSAIEQNDATGLHVFPGVVDAHVHFNEPGRTEWEGWATGTAALAAGGGTAAIEMPLNALPPTCDPVAFDAKVTAATGQARTDFALWGGLVPGNLEQLAALAARGVVGFKAFMSRSGTPDFEHADDGTLYLGMQTAAQLGLPVAVHAENDALTQALAQRAIAAGRTGVRDYLASRPPIAELEAIRRALTLAEATGCHLHVVHVSTGAGIAAILEARARGVDVTSETCPHYLLFTEEDVERIGAAAKCAPPIRTATERDALRRHLTHGEIDIVASDHSPAPATMKQNDDFFAIWGGIAGVQSTLPLLLGLSAEPGGPTLQRIAAVTAGIPARRHGLTGKGRIAVGADADLALVALDRRWTLTREELRDRHRLNPYVGMPMRGRVVRTILGGHTIALDGEPVGPPIGGLVTPTRE